MHAGIHTHTPWADTPLPPGRPPCPVHAGIHTPLSSTFWDTPPCPVHAGIHMATAADGMHPTGIRAAIKEKNPLDHPG